MRTPFTLFPRLPRLFGPSPERQAAQRLYRAVVEEARRPELYTESGVADTFDGRFDLVTLYLCLVMRRLKDEGARGRNLGQRLFDTAFADFDEALREMGAGDLSIGKKIRKMAEAFYGRLDTYERAFRTGDKKTLEEAIVRNVYRGNAPPRAQLVSLVEQVLRFADELAKLPVERLLAGRWADRPLEA